MKGYILPYMVRALVVRVGAWLRSLYLVTKETPYRPQQYAHYPYTYRLGR